jgi:replicative DNA helicase
MVLYRGSQTPPISTAQAPLCSGHTAAQDIRRRRVTVDQRKMLEWARARLHGAPLMLAKRPGIKLSQIRSLARRQAATWAKQGIKTGALIVDHVGLVNPDFPTRDRYADQTIVSNAMKELADELGCVVFGLNQMNRQNESREDKRPSFRTCGTPAPGNRTPTP